MCVRAELTLTCDLDLRLGQMTCDATGLGNPDRRPIWILNAGSCLQMLDPDEILTYYDCGHRASPTSSLSYVDPDDGP